MKTHYVIVGLDPGFANLGWSVMTWRGEKLEVVDFGCWHTVKATKKAHVLATEDNLQRCQELAGKLRQFWSDYKVAAVCSEAMSFPRSASVAAKMALVWGVIADITYSTNTPIVSPTPQRIKKALCGAGNTGKADVQEAVCKLYPESRARIEAMLVKDREHAVDSLAAIIASKDSEVLKLSRRL